MLKHRRFDIFELQETKLPVRLINTMNKLRLVQGHETTPLKVKGDMKEVKGCTSWMKLSEFYCSRRIRHLIKPVEDL
ncbi:hypothetical protein TNCV_3254401 [Trichonephila clavipes]|nr:hypothetical protein TNCV_3254401 [Trichonephila clavipes]